MEISGVIPLVQLLLGLNLANSLSNRFKHVFLKKLIGVNNLSKILDKKIRKNRDSLEELKTNINNWNNGTIPEDMLEVNRKYNTYIQQTKRVKSFDNIKFFQEVCFLTFLYGISLLIYLSFEVSIYSSQISIVFSNITAFTMLYIIFFFRLEREQRDEKEKHSVLQLSSFIFVFSVLISILFTIIIGKPILEAHAGLHKLVVIGIMLSPYFLYTIGFIYNFLKAQILCKSLINSLKAIKK